MVEAILQMFGIIIPIVIVIVIGALVRRMQWLDNAAITTRQATAFLNTLVINIALPAVIFMGLASVPEFNLGLLKIPLVAYLVIAISTGIAYIVARLLRLRRETAGSFIITAMCGSTAFFGYPIFRGLAQVDPSMQVTEGYTALYSEIGTLIPLVTAAVLIASRYGEGKPFNIWDSLTSIFRFAPFIWLVISFLFWTETHGQGGLPDLIRRLADILRGATVFLIMLSLGLTITLGDIIQYWRSLIPLNVIKLIIAPILGLILGRFLTLPPEQLLVVVVNSAVPCILLSISYASQYRLDVPFASAAVFTSFLVSLFTLPIFFALAQQLGG